MKKLASVFLAGTIAGCATPQTERDINRAQFAQIIQPPPSLPIYTPNSCIYEGNAFVTPNPDDPNIPFERRINVLLTSNFNQRGRSSTIGDRCRSTSSDPDMTHCLETLESIDSNTTDEPPVAVCSHVQLNHDQPAHIQVGLTGSLANKIEGLITVFGMSERIQFMTNTQGVYHNYDCDPRFLAIAGVHYTPQQIEVINGNDRYIFDQIPSQHQFGTVQLLPCRTR